jgi:ribonuclease BN (tRNA processing enzyme)
MQNSEKNTVKLIFQGTKGEVEESSEKHKFHSSLMATCGQRRILVDYGQLRKYSLAQLKPEAILITHAHPDHYAWLYEDIETEIPVYLTRETLEYGKYRPKNTQIISPGEEFSTGAFNCCGYRVVHSIRCPAIGFKIKINDKTFIYNSDLIDIKDKEEVLKGVDYYIGDGSSIKTNLVRRRGDALFGHTRITTQINWCKKHNISNIYFTHLGKETIRLEDEFKADHPEAVLAYDGMELEL